MTITMQQVAEEVRKLATEKPNTKYEGATITDDDGEQYKDGGQSWGVANELLIFPQSDPRD